MVSRLYYVILAKEFENIRYMNTRLPTFNPNVSETERIISCVTGSILLYDSIFRRKQNLPEAAIAGYLLFRGITGHCGVYSAIGKTKPDNRSRNVNIQVTLKVNRPRLEVYSLWRKLENLPLFMEHLEMVNSIDDNISVWEAKIPGGMGTVRWRSEIVKEIPGELLGWQSLSGSSIENAGKVEFEDAAGGGTILHVVVSYHAPWGIPGEGVARVFNPYFKQLVEDDILNFKDFLEAQNARREKPDVTEGEFLI